MCIIKEAFVSYETAKLAKEKGLDLVCRCWYKDFDEHDIYEPTLPGNYNNEWFGPPVISAPTQSLLQKWLRETHNLDILLDIDISTEYFVCVKNKTLPSKNGLLFESKNTYKTYEEALERGLQEALKLLENK